MVEGCLTARLISRAETKVGHSDPVIPYGRVIAHQIKGTLGITGLSLPSVHSGGAVWHLELKNPLHTRQSFFSFCRSIWIKLPPDVGSSHPGGGEAPKGLAVRQ